MERSNYMFEALNRSCSCDAAQNTIPYPVVSSHGERRWWSSSFWSTSRQLPQFALDFSGFKLELRALQLDPICLEEQQESQN